MILLTVSRHMSGSITGVYAAQLDEQGKIVGGRLMPVGPSPGQDAVLQWVEPVLVERSDWLLLMDRLSMLQAEVNRLKEIAERKW